MGKLLLTSAEFVAGKHSQRSDDGGDDGTVDDDYDWESDETVNQRLAALILRIGFDWWCKGDPKQNWTDEQRMAVAHELVWHVNLFDQQAPVELTTVERRNLAACITEAKRLERHLPRAPRVLQ